MEHSFVQHQLVFVDPRLLVFVQVKLFVSTQNAFRATLHFCFAHRLECYVMAIYFYCHVAAKI